VAADNCLGHGTQGQQWPERFLPGRSPNEITWGPRTFGGRHRGRRQGTGRLISILPRTQSASCPRSAARRRLVRTTGPETHARPPPRGPNCRPSTYEASSATVDFPTTSREAPRAPKARPRRCWSVLRSSGIVTRHFGRVPRPFISTFAPRPSSNLQQALGAGSAHHGLPLGRLPLRNLPAGCTASSVRMALGRIALGLGGTALRSGVCPRRYARRHRVRIRP